MEDKRFEEEIGKKYDLFKLACPHIDDIEEKIGSVIKEFSEDKTLDKINVLEIGCGTGETTLRILNASPKINIIAMDNEAVMIEQAKEKLKEFSDERLSFVEEDCLKFLKKQKDNSFEVIASGFTLHNFKKDYRKKVLEETYRVLEPRGIFINGDKYAFDNESEHRKSFDWQIKEVKDVFTKNKEPELEKEWVRHYIEDDKPEVIMKESESKDIMRQIGFKRIKTILRKHMDAAIIAEKE